MQTDRDWSPVAASGNGQRALFWRSRLESPNGYLTTGLHSEGKRCARTAKTRAANQVALRSVGMIPARVRHQNALTAPPEAGAFNFSTSARMRRCSSNIAGTFRRVGGSDSSAASAD